MAPLGGSSNAVKARVHNTTFKGKDWRNKKVNKDQLINVKTCPEFIEVLIIFGHATPTTTRKE